MSHGFSWLCLSQFWFTMLIQVILIKTKYECMCSFLMSNELCCFSFQEKEQWDHYREEKLCWFYWRNKWMHNNYQWKQKGILGLLLLPCSIYIIINTDWNRITDVSSLVVTEREPGMLPNVLDASLKSRLM